MRRVGMVNNRHISLMPPSNLMYNNSNHNQVTDNSHKRGTILTTQTTPASPSSMAVCRHCSLSLSLSLSLLRAKSSLPIMRRVGMVNNRHISLMPPSNLMYNNSNHNQVTDNSHKRGTILTTQTTPASPSSMAVCRHCSLSLSLSLSPQGQELIAYNETGGYGQQQTHQPYATQQPYVQQQQPQPGYGQQPQAGYDPYHPDHTGKPQQYGRV
eukprot:TRINITY_DN2688_c0_g1_i1.p1 TRINITY_DN2688_c0_g1~~TRINITY_DN2688_c0_g1_i1.p1  ORF type:complete len:212 (-),score=42.96 TRINITY_DN2688_c0_g1_i1:30-665(-)